MRLDHLLSMEKWSEPKRRRYIGGSLEIEYICCSIFSDRGKHVVGAVNAQGPPVPIPNTEVKLCSAEDTSRETARENRSAPTPRKGKP